MLARRFAISFITFVAFVALSVQVVLSDRGDDAFEVWLADQSDTRPGHGGQLLIYDGAHLTGKTAARARLIAAVDLGGAASDLCRSSTGRAPVRPHMLAFNDAHTHAVLSFVATATW